VKRGDTHLDPIFTGRAESGTRQTKPIEDQPTMKSLKILGFAGALVGAAVVGGTLMGIVSAAPGRSPAPAPAELTTNSQPGQYCQTFLDAFAKNLGVNESALAPAAKGAADTAIDQAVANGDLTKAVADAIKARIANANGDGCGILGARWRAALRHFARGEIRQDLVQAAATSLKLTVQELRTKLQAGDSLKQIAQDQGVAYSTVTAAIEGAAKADLDKIVAAGKMSSDREKAILDRLDKALQTGKLWNRPGNSAAGNS
jgi:hypothetical protein